MRPTPKLIAVAMLAAGVALAAQARPAPADTITETRGPVPASLLLQHADVMERVSWLAEKPAPVGPEARTLNTLLVAHQAYMEEVVLPPLSLLPAIAAGEATAEMKWALPLVQRASAGHVQHEALHEMITAQLLQLRTAAEAASDVQAEKLAQDIAGTMLGEAELIAPAVDLVGRAISRRSAEF